MDAEIQRAAAAELARRELARRQASTGAPVDPGIPVPQQSGDAMADMQAKGEYVGRFPKDQQRRTADAVGLSGTRVSKTLKALTLAPAIGAAETVATVAGAPGSFVQGGLRLLGAPPEVTDALSGTTIEGQRDLLNVDSLKDQSGVEGLTLPERVLARGVQEVGAGLPMAGGVLAAARHVASKADALPSLLTDIATNPQAFLKIDAAMNSAAGGTGEMVASAVEALGGSPETAEAGRALAALGVAVGSAKAMGLYRAVRNKYRDFAGVKTQQEIERDVSDALGELSVRDPRFFEDARTRINQFRELGIEPPPVGSASGNPAIMAEQQAALRSIPGAAEREAVRQAGADVGIRQTMRQAAPQGDPGDVSSNLQVFRGETADEGRRLVEEAAAKARAAAQTAAKQVQAFDDLKNEAGVRLSEAVGTLQTQAENVASVPLGKLGSGISARAAGDIYVGRLDEARTTFRTDANRAYESVLAGTDHRLIDVGDIKKAAAAVTAPSNPLTAQTEAANVPGVINEIAGAKTSAVTPRQLQQVRSVVLSELRKAQGGANPNPQGVRKLGEVLEAIDAKFDALASEPDTIPGLDAVNRWYWEGKRALYGGRFKDVGRELTRKGGVELDPSEVAAKFLKADTETGAEEAMDSFRAAYGRRLGLEPQPGIPEGIPSQIPDQIAMRALDEQVVNQMRLACTDPATGKVDKLKLAGWVRRHGSALNARPDLKARLSNVADAQVLADSDLRRITELEKVYEQQVIRAAQDPTQKHLQDVATQTRRELAAAKRTARNANAVFERSFGAAIDDPKGVIDEIVAMPGPKARRAVRRITAKLDANGQAGLKRGLWDSLTEKTVGTDLDVFRQGPLTDPARFRKVLKEHGPLIKEVYGDKHYSLLGTLSDVAEANTAAGRVSPSVTRIDKAQNRVHKLVSYLASRAWAVKRGVVGVPYTMTEAGGRLAADHFAKINQAEANRVLERALYDVDAFEALARVARFPNNDKNFLRYATIMRVGRNAAAGPSRATATREELRERNKHRFPKRGYAQ